MERHPPLAHKPFSELATVVPLCVHSDGAPYSKKNSCVVVSFSSLLAVGEEKLTKLVCCSFLKSDGAGGYTSWNHLLVDFEGLATGVVGGREVARDVDGTVWSFALLFVKGDEEVRSNAYGLAHFGARGEVCSGCLSGRTDRVFTDLRDTAGWRPTARMDLKPIAIEFGAHTTPLSTPPCSPIVPFSSWM